MKLRLFCTSLLAGFVVTAHAYPPELKYIKFEDALRDPQVVKVLKPGIKIQWASQRLEDEVVEHSKPDSYWRRFKRPSFIPVQDRCMEIFAEALSDMIKDAEERDYDLIADLHSIYKDKRHEDGNVFVCDHGFRVTDVTLGSTFSLTHAGATNLAKLRSDPEYLARLRSRSFDANTLLLPLGPILESSPAQKILGGMKAHWGLSDTPPFVERLGPDAYSDDASIAKLGREGACQQAVLNALSAMAKDAKSGGYDGLFMIRSHYKDQWLIDDKQVECDVGSSSAKITLRSTLVRLK
jgi:hypothetical protein